VEPRQEGGVQGPFGIQPGRQGAEQLSSLAVKGFQGTSLLDFPGRVASLLFTGGCNLTCPYCHNPGLVLEPDSYPDFPPDQLLADLRKRKAFIDGVVISGGEPTLDAGLPAFLRQLKAEGLQVKLDSNGLLPQVLEGLLAEQLIDYLAIDIKTAPQRYQELHTHPVQVERLRNSVALAKQAPIEVEFRTTCVPQLVGEAEIDAIAALLQGAPLWVLQQYAPAHALETDLQQQEPYPPEQLERFAARAEQAVDRLVLRGI
jgi:pyruvate formate lyase activating enzyme